MKLGNVLKAILAIILIIGIAGSTTVSVITLKTLDGYIKAEKAKEEEENNTETKEDDVKIADQYMIKSTLQISDAYKSGDTSELSDKDKETLDMAKKVVDKVIKKDMSDYEKEVAIYDWMTKELKNDSGLLTVIPSTQQDCDNPYGVLKFHNAVCAGYATTFRLFMQMMDIDCKVVHNNDKYHSWDLVNIDDDWYHVDIYSDAGKGDYSHFNLTDSMQQQSQSWDTDFFPNATAMKHNKIYENRIKVKDVYDVPKAIKKALKKKKSNFVIEFEEDITEEKAAVARQMITALDTVLMAVALPECPNGFGANSWIKGEDGKYMYWITLLTPDSESASTELTEKQIKKAAKALEKYFGDYAEQSGTDFTTTLSSGVNMGEMEK